MTISDRKLRSFLCFSHPIDKPGTRDADVEQFTFNSAELQPLNVKKQVHDADNKKLKSSAHFECSPPSGGQKGDLWFERNNEQSSVVAAAAAPLPNEDTPRPDKREDCLVRV